MASDIDPKDLSDIATLLARGYLRYRDSICRQLPNTLASPAESSPHVPVVNGTYIGREAVAITEVNG
jgi:hypothetical protein